MVVRLALFLTLAACAPATGTTRDPPRGDGQPGLLSRGLVPVELATVGTDALQYEPVVLLREASSGRIAPIWVGLPEAQAILRTMLGVTTPRPMTHDLLLSVVEGLGASVEEVLVHDLVGTTYVARIRLRVDGESGLREIDSRPSDALALAIRTDAPIRIAEALLVEPPSSDLLALEVDDQVVRILGATVVIPNDLLRQRFRLPDQAGLVVVGSSAEAADKGLRRGDLIVEVNGAAPAEPMDFFEAVVASQDIVHIVFWREGRLHDVKLAPPLPFTLPEGLRRTPPIRT